MSDFHNQFEAYLLEQDARYTTQKRQIVDEIAKLGHHFEVDEFIALVRQTKLSFSRATVYRTIKQLLDAGLIQKIPAPDGRVFYEQNFSKQHHDHIICNSCGSILEIMEDGIGDYLEEYCKTIGFNLDYRSLHLYGTCKNCKVS